jgi:hypothetical protein
MQQFVVQFQNCSTIPNLDPLSHAQAQKISSKTELLLIQEFVQPDTCSATLHLRPLRHAHTHMS